MAMDAINASIGILRYQGEEQRMGEGLRGADRYIRRPKSNIERNRVSAMGGQNESATRSQTPHARLTVEDLTSIFTDGPSQSFVFLDLSLPL